MRRLVSLRPLSYATALALSVAFVFASIGCAPQESAPAPSGDAATVETTAETEATEPRAEAATEVALKTADRAEFDKVLAGLKGKVVLVDYWATWCTPCTEQFPHTVAKAKELADRGFAAVSVSFDDPEDQEPILEFLRDNDASAVANLVSAHGAAPESNQAFDVQGGIPWYQLYDREGELKYVFCDAPEPGVEALPVDQLDAKIEELLGEPQE